MVVGEELVAGIKDGGDFGNQGVDLVDGVLVALSEAVGDDEIEKPHGVDGEEGLGGSNVEFLGELVNGGRGSRVHMEKDNTNWN